MTKQAFDETRIMPDDAVLAEIRTAIEAYNAQRPAMHMSMLNRQFTMMAPYVVVAVAVVVTILLLVERPTILGFVIPLLALGGYVLLREAGRPLREFRQTLRDRMMPLIFGFAGVTRYANGIAPKFMAKLPNPGVVRFSMATYDDLIAGTYEGMDFTLSEVLLSTGADPSEVVFDGVILYFNPAHPFPGRLYAAKRLSGMQGLIDGFFGDRSLQPVASGSYALDQIYEFRTDRPQDAGPLVTNQIATVLDYLAEAWPDGVPRLALSGGDAFVLVPTGRDFFELPDADRDIDYARHVLPMIRDLVTLLAMAQLIDRICQPDS